MNNIRKYPDANFRLTNDIIFEQKDFSENGAFYNAGTGWQPIGAFSGYLDGSFYEIKNLYIKAANYAAFIYENTGTIKNFQISNANVSCIKSISGTAGKNTYAYASCLVYKNNGVIEYCNTSGQVYAENKAEGYVHSYAAGLVVHNSTNGHIRYSYNNAKVVAKSICTNTQASYAYAGGICANNGDNNLTDTPLIDNCYNIGEILGISEATYYSSTYRAYVGGISAINHNYARIDNCLNVGKISSEVNYTYGATSTSEVTAVSGITNNSTEGNYFGGKSTNCYCTITYSDYNSTICNEEELALESTFKNWDFQNIWVMGFVNSKIHPILKRNCSKHTIVTDKRIESSCVSNGKTEGSHCSTCFAIISLSKIIPATGHSYENNVCQYCQIKDLNSGLVYQINDTKTAYSVIRNDNNVDSTIIIRQSIHNLPVTNIEASVFSRCQNIETIGLPEGLLSIGDYAFEYCTNLTNIQIPKTVTTIGKEAFYCCDNITSISIPDGVKVIKNKTFAGCDKLTNVQLCDGLEKIMEYAFGWCYALEKIDIPNTVTEIEKNAFYACTYLKTVVLPVQTNNLYNVFYACDNINYYFRGTTIPEGLNIYSYTKYYFYSNQEPTDTKQNYWHYVDGLPVAW